MAGIEITPHTFFFLLSTILTLGGAIGVVNNRNLVRGSIWLIVSLFGVAGYFVLLHAPFLAAVQVLVYIGAIGILITFAVMLTRGMTQLQRRFSSLWWLGASASLLLFIVLLFTVIEPIWGDLSAVPDAPPGSTTDLGIALVSGDGFVLPFEVAAVLLTAAMIGAIVLAREARNADE
ncbi:MAG: NADH-quinone oxidoreductase subunit J [Anaerolineaceae bacterium]|nr:NADH-quinone oxidoreductase subunit J [Anaerolineaceae bacterium]MCY3935319.1 NADH-quinone oxidoreductase subunit J [Chloroflexota bacterium]MCY4009732.1 NADH-quinone oxidoreductase subunit J [Anaerolineaceae bacterium]MCY4106588.1 NADH-quinone oxidoreductase subunit J [Chloroflexota bacterium]